MKKAIPNQPKISVSWTEIMKLTEVLASKIEKSGIKFSNICGIPRGGYITAVLLSHRLNLPLVEVIEIGKNTLIVDDINDTGDTLKNLSIWWGELENKTAVFYERCSTKLHSEFVGEVLTDNWWIVFPWEVEKDD